MDLETGAIGADAGRAVSIYTQTNHNLHDRLRYHARGSSSCLCNRLFFFLSPKVFGRINIAGTPHGVLKNQFTRIKEGGNGASVNLYLYIYLYIEREI